MNWLVSAEPAPWLSEVAAREQAVVIAPWRWSTTMRPLGVWPVVRLGARLWHGQQAARMHASRLALREALGRLLAAPIPIGIQTLYAPSLVALPLFAVAKARGVRCVLIEDLPDLRQLHADLDAAAAAHPNAAFLRNHRAIDRHVVQQQRERVLADERLCTSAFAARQHPTPARPLLPPQPGLVPASARPDVPVRPTLLLAGPAMARLGSHEALAAAELLGATLLVRSIDATEPAGLLRHRLVRAAPPEALRFLRGVDAVLAPSWVEANPPGVALAVALGVPVVATERAAGWWPEVRRVAVGDANAIAEALVAQRTSAVAAEAAATNEAKIVMSR